MEKKSNTHQ